MKEETFERVLNAFNRRQPFKPFVVELVSGAELTIDHPEALVYRAGAAMHIDSQGNFTLFDNEGVSRLKDVKANGSSRSRK